MCINKLFNSIQFNSIQLMDGWLDGWMDGWIDEFIFGWIYRLMDGWMDGWMNLWMDGRMDRWIVFQRRFYGTTFLYICEDVIP